MKPIFFFTFIALIFCSSCTKSFYITKNAEQIEGVKDGYRYELWNQNSQGTAYMKLGKGALFSGKWSDVENYLARRGLSYNQTQKHQEIGTFSANFDCDYRPSRDTVGASYLSVYGWTVEPLAEYYIIENWQNWMPAMGKSAVLKGSFFMDGSYYDVYKCIRENQPSIVGTTTFPQYFSIRRNKRSSGTIHISKHFNKWESLGLDMGKMHEVSFVVEGYHNSGEFNFKKLDISVQKQR